MTDKTASDFEVEFDSIEEAENEQEQLESVRFCFNCGEPLKELHSEIKCIGTHYKCEHCNIIQDGDIGQLYHCCRCNRVIEDKEELVFEFITPNWKEMSFCPKPMGIKQYLCGKCHERAIHPKRFKRIRKIPMYVLFGLYCISRRVRV